jgi:hypothetical protein
VDVCTLDGNIQRLDQNAPEGCVSSFLNCRGSMVICLLRKTSYIYSGEVDGISLSWLWLSLHYKKIVD